MAERLDGTRVPRVFEVREGLDVEVGGLAALRRGRRYPVLRHEPLVGLLAAGGADSARSLAARYLDLLITLLRDIVDERTQATAQSG